MHSGIELELITQALTFRFKNIPYNGKILYLKEKEK